MVYTPTGQPFTLDTPGFRGKKIKARWLNPLNGQYTVIDISTISSRQEFKPPTESNHPDWTLVLEVADLKGCHES